MQSILQQQVIRLLQLKYFVGAIPKGFVLPISIFLYHFLVLILKRVQHRLRETITFSLLCHDSQRDHRLAISRVKSKIISIAIIGKLIYSGRLRNDAHFAVLFQ
jgi:hypothetical protein